MIWAMASIKNKQEEKEAKLGKGTFGLVKVGQNREGKAVAIKIQRNLPKKLPNEIAMTKMADPDYHKGEVIRKRNRQPDKNNIWEDKHYTVTELLPGTELFKRIYSDKDGAVRRESFTEKQKLIIALKCAEALHALHQKAIIHADIKPANIMIHIEQNGEIKIKIIDYGEAIALEKGKEKILSTNIKGSPQYMAPEIATYDEKNHPLTEGDKDGNIYFSVASDTYSLAVLFKDDLQLKIPDKDFDPDPDERTKLPDVIEHLKKEIHQIKEKEKEKENSKNQGLYFTKKKSIQKHDSIPRIAEHPKTTTKPKRI
jgi:serine/threonine protein kinase